MNSAASALPERAFCKHPPAGGKRDGIGTSLRSPPVVACDGTSAISAARTSINAVLQYDHTYRYNGWPVLLSEVGTRFINDSTCHGMFVSLENTYPF
jgi:hypothetical protein